MIYKYDTRYIVQFSDKTKASYSKQRYGILIDKIAELSEKEDRKIWNYYEVDNNVCKIFYWDQKEKDVKIILIDKENKDLIYNYYWQLNHNGYPQTRTNGRKIYLYNLIMNTSDKQIVDHIDHNPLNNCKNNLYLCNSVSENNINQKLSTRNTSGYIGISKTNNNKWRARITYEGKEISKNFDTKEEAIKQREEWNRIYKPWTFND